MLKSNSENSTTLVIPIASADDIAILKQPHITSSATPPNILLAVIGDQ